MTSIDTDTLMQALGPAPVRSRPFHAFVTRLARGWRLARGRLTKDDAWHLYLQCQTQLGWYPLDLLTTDDTIEESRDIYEDNPDLTYLITRACETVGRVWKATENTAKARVRVFELAEAYSHGGDQAITFPLVRRTAPRDSIASHIHALYAPKGVPQIAPQASPMSVKKTGHEVVRRATGKAHEIPAVSFNNFDYAAARRDGWCLILLETDPDGAQHAEIQANRSRGFGKCLFSCDREAWKHVVNQTKAGSILHRQALALIHPREREIIETATGPW